MRPKSVWPGSVRLRDTLNHARYARGHGRFQSRARSLRTPLRFAEAIANARGHRDAPALEALRRGVTLADGPTRPAEVRHIAHRGARTVFEIAITEGRNRQVRRMVREVGSKVETLVRTAIGPLELGELASGVWRPLTRAEQQALQRAVRSAER